MTENDRFLTRYHAETATAADIFDEIERWHEIPRRVDLHVHLGMSWDEFEIFAATGILPSARIHGKLGRVDAILLSNGEALKTHGPLFCQPPCPVHWPSEHELAGRPLNWDAEQGIVTRVCRHGVEHPYPDDRVVRLNLLNRQLINHECDCCCGQIIEGELAEQAELVSAPRAIEERAR